ncbi:hypothetical protein sm9_2323 [Methanobrevibacter millerae]|uniref:Uncharacterized protein n=1 Tax=Methanobrevibacter millerae TaxID=230361 RepID=A0A0U3CWM2_9EURY|nr:hypothetical protein sm9_2323 [Methanobrevibacter millerae]
MVLHLFKNKKLLIKCYIKNKPFLIRIYNEIVLINLFYVKLIIFMYLIFYIVLNFITS